MPEYNCIYVLYELISVEIHIIVKPLQQIVPFY